MREGEGNCSKRRGLRGQVVAGESVPPFSPPLTRTESYGQRLGGGGQGLGVRG